MLRLVDGDEPIKNIADCGGSIGPISDVDRNRHAHQDAGFPHVRLGGGASADASDLLNASLVWVPFARAFLGDRLRDEQLYDEATTAYDALLRLVPDDPAASFRLALAGRWRWQA